MIAEGIHAIGDHDYLNDPCSEPSLSNSVAKILVDQSPAHAYYAHPRLGGRPDEDASTEAMEIGTAAHALFLRGEDAVAVIDYPTYQTKASREERDAAKAAGRIPLKRARYDRMRRVVDKLEAFRARTGAFTGGLAERTLVWREGDCWSRAKVDYLPDQPRAPLWDLKITGLAATEQEWGRAAFNRGYELQEAFYCRGAEMTRGQSPEGMCFCVAEIEPPYGIAVFRLAGAAREIGDAKAGYAIGLWEQCMRSGDWPGYSPEPVWIEPPVWLRSAWEYRTATGRGLKLPPRDPAFPIVPQSFTKVLVEAGHFGG